MATKADLRNLVLQELGALAAEETATAADAALVGGALDRIHARLEGLGLTAMAGGSPWDIETVPDAVADAYVTMAAHRLSRAYGLPADRRAELVSLAAEAERDLRRLCRTPYDGEPVTATYF